MAPRMPVLPPSRRNKKQIAAFLDAELVKRYESLRASRKLTVQEIVGEAVNRAVAEYGRQPILTVGRERLVRRKKSLSKVQSASAGPRSRAGKRRMAGWFDRQEVDKVSAFKIEVGVRIEDLVEMGLRLIMKDLGRSDAG